MKKVVIDGDMTLLSSADGETMQILEVSRVTGVKGEAETQYRWGDVNLTRADLGIFDITEAEIDSVTGV